MKLNELLTILFPSAQSKKLTLDQHNIVRHPNGPAWVIAGPGSGKTEVLTILVLRLLYVSGDPAQKDCVPPEAIWVTTFTDKAARNLEDRISVYRAKIIAAKPSLANIDTSKLRIGTLHSLCNDLLQEHRSPNYQNVRLMDDLEQAMFMYEQMSIVKTPNAATDSPFWLHFSFMFRQHEWQPSKYPLPSKWERTDKLVKIFNRIVEDRVSAPLLIAAGGQWARLAALYEEYRQKLTQEHRCDFSHLQALFLEFLQTPLGEKIRKGSTAESLSGIQWVLVDEYQDTNLIQEEIYLSLADNAPHNIVVVGDDDQAMYRFRGGSVECMVTFDNACGVFLSPKIKVTQYPLVDNFRSHPNIVKFCNDYISSFPAMKVAGNRIPGKPALVAKSSITGNYPAVGVLQDRTVDLVAQRFAETVRDLRDNGIVQNVNQCCLLLKSTKESPRNAGPYVSALLACNLRVYNPRNKAFLEQEEVAGLLGALLAMLDPNRLCEPPNSRDISDLLPVFRNAYASLATTHANLAHYVAEAVKHLAAKPDKFLTANLQEILYYLMSFPPFATWQNDPVRRIRMGRLTELLESYASMPVPNHANVSRGNLKSAVTGVSGVNQAWMNSFYYLFVGYLARTGLDEREDEETICPPDMVPVMTMHQAKGLEFPFVFVGNIGEDANPSAVHEIESVLSKYPMNSKRTFVRPSAQTRAELDMIRQYFVAYSRAQYALIILGTKSHFKKGRVPCGPDAAWLPNRTLPL